MNCRVALIGLVAALPFVPAAANISSVTMSGPGIITYSIPGRYDSPPPVGTLVNITQTITFGIDPYTGFPIGPPDDFTGDFELSIDYLYLGLITMSGFIDDRFAYIYNRTLTFDAGKLVGIDILVDYDQSVGALTESTFSSYLYGYDDASWGGTWTPFADSPVPEPLTWALLVAGFGLIGSRIRRRRMLAV